MKFIDLSGKKFGRLVVLSASEVVNGQRRWDCVCDCGNKKNVMGACLRNGSVKSCGCLHSEKTIERHLTHGLTRTPTYKSWSAMKRRCSDKNHPAFKSYMGKGISVCDEWINSFEKFLEDMGDRPENLTLDRINNDLGYFKENCRWATRSQQNSNQHHPKKPGLGKKLSFNGMDLTIREWSIYLGIPIPTMQNRIKKGLSVELVLSKRRLSANQYFKSF